MSDLYFDWGRPSYFDIPIIVDLTTHSCTHGMYANSSGSGKAWFSQLPWHLCFGECYIFADSMMISCSIRDPHPCTHYH